MAKGVSGSSLCGHRSLASVIGGMSNILQSVVAFAGIVLVQTASASAASPTATSVGVGVNQGLLVTG